MFNFLPFHLFRKNNLLVFVVIILSNSTYINAQTISVSGKITSSRFAVSNASVTFVNNADTTIKYNALTDSKGYYQIDQITSVNSDQFNIPTTFNLGQSYPNPFSSSTAIPYGLNEESNIEVIIYDILGRSVRKFDVGRKSIGTHNLLWDGKNNTGQKVSSGIYFYKFLVNGDSQVRKMIFNQNGNGSFVIPNTFSLRNNESLEKGSHSNNIGSTNFTIRLRNTNSSIPLLIEEDIENVVIQNDTTINFSVSSKTVSIVNFDSTHQIIRGFGASNILLWRPDMTDSEIETAFGFGEGQLGFTILRLMVEADSNRWGLYIPTAKKAYEKGAIIIAAPWYAPSDMVETVNGISRVKYDKYDEYAAHLDAFSRFMSDNGVPLYGISIQNEPDITDQWTSWTPSEMFTFMKENAHAISGTKVMAPESFQFRRNMTDPILNDSIACANTDIICGHIYGGGLASYPLAEEKGKEVWMTEYLINSPGSGANMDTSLTGAMATAISINSCMSANMNAYVWWYIVRYYGPINDETGFAPRLPRGAVTKKGYVMSQFARFIRPGYNRVESQIYPASNEISITAYEDPESDKIILVVINSSSNQVEQNFRVQGGAETTSFIPYTTSATKNCEQGSAMTVSNDNFKFILEPSSITTFVSN